MDKKGFYERMTELTKEIEVNENAEVLARSKKLKALTAKMELIKHHYSGLYEQKRATR